MSRISLLLSAAVSLVSLTGGNCSAAMITMVHSGSGAGTLDGVAFDAAFTITSIGDTDDRIDLGGGAFSITHLSSEISIDGLGVFDFLISTRTFSASGIGFGRGPNDSDLLSGPADSPLDTWDMLSSIGPVTGAMSTLQWGPIFGDVETTGGILVFDDAEGLGTFEAIVEGDPGPPNPVPEPTSSTSGPASRSTVAASSTPSMPAR